MQSLLKVSLKDKAVYLHPDQIKDCYKTLNLALPTVSICQKNLDQFVTVNIPQQQNESVEQPAQSDQTPQTVTASKIETNPTKAVDAGSDKRSIRAKLVGLDETSKLAISSQVVSDYLFTQANYQIDARMQDSDVVFYFHGFASRLADFEKTMKNHGISKDKPLVVVVWQLTGGESSAEKPATIHSLDATVHPNCLVIHLLGRKDEGITDSIEWNPSEIEKCEAFIRKQVK